MDNESEEKVQSLFATTTSDINGREISNYLGIVNGVAITGFGFFRQFMSAFTDFFGGRSASYQKEFVKTKDLALFDLKAEAVKLGADAVVGIKLDYENISSQGRSFVMTTATGTAVKLK